MEVEKKYIKTAKVKGKATKREKNLCSINKMKSFTNRCLLRHKRAAKKTTLAHDI